MLGLSALRSLLDPAPAIAAPAPSSPAVPFASDLPTLDRLIDLLAADKQGLVMVMGKGGVGKTTIAASIALGRSSVAIACISARLIPPPILP